jgi:glutathionyl-hydroquinone reductase
MTAGSKSMLKPTLEEYAKYFVQMGFTFSHSDRASTSAACYLEREFRTSDIIFIMHVSMSIDLNSPTTLNIQIYSETASRDGIANEQKIKNIIRSRMMTFDILSTPPELFTAKMLLIINQKSKESVRKLKEKFKERIDHVDDISSHLKMLLKRITDSGEDLVKNVMTE